MEGNEQLISQGPAAAVIPIKQLGTNGGGYFGVNSSHPLENPTYLTNMVECWSILILPMAMVFALGFYLKRKKLSYTIFGVMLFAYLASVGINTYYETKGNPMISQMGIDQGAGAMEGKETRSVRRQRPCGVVRRQSPQTVPSTGCTTVRCRSAMMEMLNMQINTWFGGVGVGS